ncbi:MAG: TolC family protein [Acidobacteria bacterium]|nr:TolC family protein [Acidobacteriota bacterium]
MNRRLLAVVLAGACLVAPTLRAEPGQSVTPTRMTFKDAIARAIERNPSGQQAAAEILRADALLGQVRAGALPQVTANVTTTTLNGSRLFGTTVSTPQNQVAATVTASAPLYAPLQWALRVQLMDNKQVAELAAVDVRRQVAVATAQAYLAVVARQRVLDANQRARETAQAHYDFAHQRRESGAGSRLNELRAQQSVSSIDVLVEQTQADLYRAQEALGVFVADNGPVTAGDEPLLDVPPSLDAAIAAMSTERTDLRLAAGREKAAARVVTDSWKDWLPSVSGLFQPQYVNPGTAFQPVWSWRLQISANMPIFDAGSRREKRAEREVLLKESQIAVEGLVRQAKSDERTAENAVARAERAWAAAKSAAQQARDVVDIVNISFKVGASTNIEVIDAQRAALDADTAAAVAEDQLRQARLALLVALGRFPQ